jgi:hypothetical protein
MAREETLAELARQADEQATARERERRFHEQQDGRRLNYHIGDAALTIRFATFKLMTIPYAEIIEVELGSVFTKRPSQVNLSNGFRKMCRIRKSRGWFRYVLITPREPKDLLNALSRFRLLVDPITEFGETNAPVPPFLRPKDQRIGPQETEN